MRTGEITGPQATANTGIHGAQETDTQREIRNSIDQRSSTKQFNSWRYEAQGNNSTAGLLVPVFRRNLAAAD
ncbi:hypothetical protein F511_19306 [Dorcoceras hygrometricum]|uniref:Uncharacterized protein n=1 Tax=Dorcoceras hygrometricum TaxID=472368 RepID=A0A2Z7CW24_9LAMI|nr:hypothetical protein F511_19306 [Dorcoceras hygrometricum]